MKKIFSVLICILTVLSTFTLSGFAEDEYIMKREDILVRDPYILVYENKYYMYGTGLSNGEGYGCCISEDLENWTKPIQVFSPSNDFDGFTNYWAPECHYYNGSFYLFATYKSEASQKRGVGIFKSDSPVGPFELITNGHVTPKEIDCIDGTLYIDDNSQPWMVYVNEWTSQPDGIGEMAAAKLSDDLTEFISEPIVLFRANNHIWTDNNVTDGPFMYKTSDGKLIMLWSNGAKSGGYAVGMAVSSNGKIDGKWIHYPKAIYSQKEFAVDGGHPMMFKALDGSLIMAIHSPNSSGNGYHETATFLEIEDNGSSISIKDSVNTFEKIFTDVYIRLLTFLTDIFS